MSPLHIAVILFSFSIAVLIISLLIIAYKYRKLLDKQMNLVTESNSIMSVILNNIPDIAFLKDKDLRYTYVNKAFLNILEIEEDQIIGKTDSSLPQFSKETAKRLTAIDKYVLKKRHKYSVEEHLELSNTNEIIVHTNKTPLIVNDEAVGIVGISHDITKRKAMDAQKMQRQRYLEKIKNALSEIMADESILAGNYFEAANIIAKIGCKVLDVTRVVVWQYIPEENLLKSFSVFDDTVGNAPLIQDYRLPDNYSYKELLFNERIIVFDAVTGTDIDFYDYNTNLNALIDAPINVQGRLFGLISIEQEFNENYDKKRHWTVEEHAFASSMADIMALAVTGFQRNKAQAAAEVANDMKSEFLSKMSHELRTPLSSIVGFAELALGSNPPEESKEYIEKIIINTELLTDSINDLLDISKIESGKIELERVPFEISDILLGCRATFLPQIAEKKLRFYLHEELTGLNKLPLGDPKKLWQILQNLLSNAVKFTQSGMIVLTATVNNVDETKTTVHFEVKDSGIGMTQEQAEKIFFPFAQADSSTTRKYGGTGLGLSIASNLVAIMGGNLTVVSQLGTGSTFSFDLTFDTVDRDSYTESLDDERYLSKSKRPIFKGEVLLCEDSEMMAHMISTHLEKAGLNVDIAENGKICVNKIVNRIEQNQKQYDIILMDIHMPVMDGKEATKIILTKNIGVPIIAVTANVLADDLASYGEIGFSDTLSKPFTAFELWTCLKKYLPIVSWREESATASTVSKNTLNSRLIQIFLKDGKEKMTQIRNAMNLRDFEQAHRLVHTLKGNAGQLRLVELTKIATEIENQLRLGHYDISRSLLDKLEPELSLAINKLSKQTELSPTNDISTPQEQDRLSDQDKNKILITVKEHLIDRDAACLEFIPRLRNIKDCELLIEQIENFDFKLATDTVNELLQREEVINNG